MEPVLRCDQERVVARVGGLAAVVHDLNNLLTPILGYAEILLSALEPGSKAHDHAQEIYNAARRSGDLVNRLLVCNDCPRRQC